MRQPRGDRGSGTVLVLGLVAVALVLATTLVGLGQVVAGRARAQTAADLAALAAATRLQTTADIGDMQRANELLICIGIRTEMASALKCSATTVPTLRKEKIAASPEPINTLETVINPCMVIVIGTTPAPASLAKSKSVLMEPVAKSPVAKSSPATISVITPAKAAPMPSKTV